MKRYPPENTLKDFLDAPASRKAGELIGDTFSGADLAGVYFTPEQKNSIKTTRPCMATREHFRQEMANEG